MKESSKIHKLIYAVVGVVVVVSIYYFNRCTPVDKDYCLPIQRTPAPIKSSAPKRVLVTGAAGFIGFHLARTLNKDDRISVVAMDNFNDYYEVRLKKERAYLLNFDGIEVYHEDVCHREFLEALLSSSAPSSSSSSSDNNNSSENSSSKPPARFTHVVHLAAQAGVRYSLDNPLAYVRANLKCQVVLLEVLKKFKNIKLVYASSSSVYGKHSSIPFSLDQATDTPGNMYAATKKTDELLGRYYCENHGISSVGLRFFTVYGPWGRPDMATYKFADAMYTGKQVPMFHTSDHDPLQRDFTYVDDIVSGIVTSLDYVPSKCGEKFNLGFGRPVSVPSMIEILGKEMKITPNIKKLPLPATEILKTWADTSVSKKLLHFDPQTNLTLGIRAFVQWYKAYSDSRKFQKKDDNVNTYYEKINRERINRDARFENIKMIRHNRELHARLKKDRKIYFEWAKREGIFTPVLCDIKFKITNDLLQTFQEICVCPSNFVQIGRNCISRYSEKMAKSLRSERPKDAKLNKQLKIGKSMHQIEGLLSKGGDYMSFNRTHLKTNVTFYKDICQRDPLCIGFTSDGLAKRRIAEYYSWVPSKSSMYVFDIDYCSINGVSCNENASCKRLSAGRFACVCNKGFKRSKKWCHKSIS